MKIDPAKTGVVLIEFQNDFTSEGGTLHGAVKEVMSSTNMLDNAAKTVEEARKCGATIFHVPISFVPGYNEISQHPYGILKGVVDTNSFLKDSWGSEFDEKMVPKAEDIIIEGKRGLDVFASTNLNFILRSRGIETLVIGGFLTNCCVESTMRTAYEQGFNVITLTDCTACTSAYEQEAATTKTFPMFSHPMQHDAFLAALDGSVVADSSRGYQE
jgi:nicotinamidase-related amidase